MDKGKRVCGENEGGGSWVKQLDFFVWLIGNGMHWTVHQICFCYVASLSVANINVGPTYFDWLMHDPGI
jgi:hypothetical protein